MSLQNSTQRLRRAGLVALLTVSFALAAGAVHAQPKLAVIGYEFSPKQPQPKDKRFNGKVYTLVNRQTHSQAAVTAAQIQDYAFGTIVGEETGEYPTLQASIFQYPLPNTGIPVNVAKGYIVRVNGSEKQQGVRPDIIIKDHLLDERDEIIDGLLQMLD